MSSTTGNLAGRLRLGASDGTYTSEELGVQRALNRFLDDGSEVFIELTLGTPSQLEQMVADGELDVAIGPFRSELQALPMLTTRASLILSIVGRSIRFSA